MMNTCFTGGMRAQMGNWRKANERRCFITDGCVVMPGRGARANAQAGCRRFPKIPALRRELDRDNDSDNPGRYLADEPDSQ